MTMTDKQRARFWTKVDKTDSCWFWTGALINGYGVFGATGRSRTNRAHRLAYEELVGPIPEGMVLDHRCHNDDAGCAGGKKCPHRRCVNPAHLAPATNRDNVLAGRGMTAENARRTTCREGHPLDVSWGGGRRCKACYLPMQRAWKTAQRVRRLAADRGECIECGRSVQLRTDGAVRRHAAAGNGAVGSWSSSYRCPGSRRLPRPAKADVHASTACVAEVLS